MSDATWGILNKNGGGDKRVNQANTIDFYIITTTDVSLLHFYKGQDTSRGIEK